MPTPNTIGSHLRALRSHFRAGRSARGSVLRELADHMEDRRDALMAERGMSRDEADAEAVRAFGDARAVASQLSWTHNQGTWRETGLSALPHLVAGLLFAFHRWYEPEWLVAAFGLAIVMSVIGWRTSRAVWMYPWMGYAIFPFLLAGTVSIATVAHGVWSIATLGYTATDPLSWALGVALGIMGIILIATLLVWTSKREWTHAALLVLPIPFLSVALLAFDRGTYGRLEEADAQAAILFAFVAVAVAVIVRMGDRLVKIGLLAASLPLGFLLSSGALDANVRILVAILLSLPALLLVLAPFLVSLGGAAEDEIDSVPLRPR